MRALGQDQIGPIFELISHLFWPRKGPNGPKSCAGTQNMTLVYSGYLFGAFGGHFGAFRGDTRGKKAPSNSFWGRSECVLAPFLGPKGPLSYTGAVFRTLLD